jgi:transposase
MTGTVTWAGLDVHARSTHAAAIDVMTGELVRAKFGAGLQEPLAWLAALPGPVKACYEAGPTGYGLYRAARAAGVEMMVIAPGKTPRGPSDRVKTDRKDAELLARLLLAGSLTAVVVPPPEFEAARDLMRAHDACRRDLMDARHRVLKAAAALRPCLPREVDVDGPSPRLAWTPAVRPGRDRAGLRRRVGVRRCDQRPQERVGAATLRARAR